MIKKSGSISLHLDEDEVVDDDEEDDEEFEDDEADRGRFDSFACRVKSHSRLVIKL